MHGRSCGTWMVLVYAALGAAGTHAAQPLREPTALPAPSAPMPGGAKAAQAPLWSFAWASDLHLDESRREFIAKALRHIDEELKPDFVLITGDNNAIAAPPADARRPEPLGMRRQRYFKAFLKEHLKAPCVVIPGDNWPEGFDQVFGAKQFSFDYGGLHFLLLAPDRTYHGEGSEGLSVFDEPTWAWMRRDLDAHRSQPTVVAIHEPMYPCTFLDAPRLRGLLDRYANVIAAFQGHLHVDWEFRLGGRTYLVAPALGRSPRPAMKLIHVCPDMLILRTAEYQRSADRFQWTDRWQKIEIALPLRGGLGRPPRGGFVMANYDAVPPHPHVNDPTLARRKGELLKILAQSLGSDLFRFGN